MTITEDSSAPIAVHVTTTSGTTASFTPPSQSLLVVMVAADGGNVATTATVSDSGSHTWTLLKRQNTTAVGALGGTAEVWCTYLSSAPGSITVTASGWSTVGGNIVTKVLLGAAQTQNGATGGSGGSSIAPTATLTPTQIGSRIYGAALDFTTNAVLTANGNSSSIDQFNDATNGDTWAAFKGAADTTTLTSTTYGFTNANAAYNVAIAEILAATTTAPAFPFNGDPRRRLFAAPRLPRARMSTPVRAQVNPPFPFNEFHQPRQLRGRLPRRGEAFMPIPAQVVVPPPPYPPQGLRERLKFGRVWRGRFATPVPAQVVVTPPAYPPLSVRTRVKGLRLFRGHAVSPVPPQVTVPLAAFVPPAVRGRLKLPAIRRHDIAPPIVDQQFVPQTQRSRWKAYRPARGHTVTPPPQQASAPLFTRIKLRMVRVFRGKPRPVVPAQVILIAPPYPPQPTRGRRNQFAARRHRGGVEGWMVPGVHLCVTPRPNTGTTGRGSTGVTAYNTATTARPGTGTTSRPNTGTTTDPC